MAVQALVEQHVIFMTNSGSFDENAILANSLIQSLAQNSAGADLVVQYENMRHWNGASFDASTFFEIKCYVTPAFQTTIQQNIPNLQAAFPQYTIVTWGINTSFGN